MRRIIWLVIFFFFEIYNDMKKGVNKHTSKLFTHLEKEKMVLNKTSY